ncbi:hypothetical protein [Rhodobacter sp. 24-YEA-8]|uniref:hypothetical protein n=1 Tax=Rhodobacter sp. 24-YEA-8 TaxID=1884310 RepID=UPI000897E5DD|nr:hypothetical protein [Rhodobacter sp. 24-YEA-8]SEB51139.1 hypothetical protein SAMN05519105_0581 [Rhodobacter sp. 24-YEA-8]SEB56435.1 hypothetical protein SAMN05519105_0770 [Rhodobacter sp. 24-YEA-8]
MEDFKFRAARLCTPHENLCAAIGLIQTQILANEKRLNPEVMFGLSHFKTVLLKWQSLYWSP